MNNYSPREHYHYLYHIRNAETSFGLGHDGYVGYTDNPQRRKKQHFSKLEKNKHSNQALQNAYNASPDAFQFWIAKRASLEEVQASERLLVPRQNHHLNKQKGGGPARGMSKVAAVDILTADEKVRRADRSAKRSTNKGEPCQEPNAGAGPRAASVGSGGLLLADVAAAAGVVTATAASGLGTAYALNKTIFKDDVNQPPETRNACKIARKGTFVGGGTGAVGAIVLVASAGNVGLGAAGTLSGLAAIGGTVGGGAVIGGAVVLAIPAAAAAVVGGVGYGIYQAYRYYLSQ